MPTRLNRAINRKKLSGLRRRRVKNIFFSGSRCHQPVENSIILFCFGNKASPYAAIGIQIFEPFFVFFVGDVALSR